MSEFVMKEVVLEDNIKAQIRIYRDEYKREQDAKTLKRGKIYTITAIASLSFFIIQDLYIVQEPIFIITRLIALIPAIIYLVALLTLLTKRTEYVTVFHSMNLLSINLMMLVVCFIVHTTEGYTDDNRHAVITGLLAVIFGTYAIAGSIQKHLVYIVGVPFAVLITTLIIFNPGISLKTLSYFSNALISVVIVIVLGFFQERLSQREFIMRMIADKSKDELEQEVEKVRKLNTELQDKITENKILEKKLIHQAMYDAQTGMMNKNPGLETLARDMDFCIRSGSRLTVCYADMDDLKWINDNYGHAEGDRVIGLIADCINRCIRKSDYAIRMGGDEFIIIFRNCTEASARSALTRIKEEMVKSCGINCSTGNNPDKEYVVNFSTGFIEYDPLTKSGVDEVIHIADSRMYDEKNQKRKITLQQV